MSVIDVAKLLSPVSADAPAGADVEADPAFLALETMAKGTPESVMGDEVKPAREADWKEVKKTSLELFSKSRDLRVAMILAAALLKEDGVAGFREGVAVIRGFVEQLWEQFYPRLDPTDNNDPTIRVNILKAFEGDGSEADLFKYKRRLREATLTNSKKRIGRFSYRDVQVAKGEVPPPAAGPDGNVPKIPDMALINAAFEDTATEDLAATQQMLKDSVADLVALDKLVSEKAGQGVGADMTGLKQVLGELSATVNEQLAKRGMGDASAAGTESAGAGGGRGVAISGEIGSRTDVIRVLDKICEYYERFEPASPVPMFMKRAKRLVTMNFVDVIKDLAPEAMQKIDVYAGQQPAPPA